MPPRKKTTTIIPGKESPDVFFLTFIGELVEMAGSFLHDGKETDIKVLGYILDMDDNYYFLGETPEEITKAIKRESVIYIEILNPDNIFREMLDEMEVPKNEQEKN